MNTCPNPDNGLLNNLNNNNFQFGLKKIPTLEFKVTKVQIPGINIEPPKQATTHFSLPLKGTNLVWEDLQIEFIVDEGMKNYKLLYYWLTNFCSCPNECIKNLNTDLETDDMWDFSDGFLHVYDITKTKVLHKVKFIDLVPTSLSAIQFDVSTSEVQAVTATAGFMYSYWRFEDLGELKIS